MFITSSHRSGSFPRKEKSENNERNAKAAQSYVNSGLIPVDALAKGVANKLVEDGFYPGLGSGA
jgi:hypothetical protein